MRRWWQLMLGLLALAAASVAAEGQYARVAEIPIGGAGGFDYLTIDSDGKRLYLAHTTEVVVVDTDKDAVVGRIADTPGVHGVAVVRSLGRLFTTNGRENKVAIVDAKTLATTEKVETGQNPDAINYDPARKEIWSWNHAGHSATVIDAASGKVAATVPLAGVAESGGIDGGRAFVNIEDKDSIDVIDTAKRVVIAHWSVAPAESPTGMAVDTAGHRLFVGGGPKLVMMDDASGKVVASVPICGGTDGTAYDPSAKLVFVSCSDGKMTIARADRDSLTVVQTLDTARGARTVAVDPATHRVYVAAVAYAPPDPNAPPPAAGQRPRSTPIPDSLRVLVFAPGK